MRVEGEKKLQKRSRRPKCNKQHSLALSQGTSAAHLFTSLQARSHLPNSRRRHRRRRRGGEGAARGWLVGRRLCVRRCGCGGRDRGDEGVTNAFSVCDVEGRRAVQKSEKAKLGYSLGAHLQRYCCFRFFCSGFDFRLKKRNFFSKQNLSSLLMTSRKVPSCLSDCVGIVGIGWIRSVHRMVSRSH